MYPPNQPAPGQQPGLSGAPLEQQMAGMQLGAGYPTPGWEGSAAAGPPTGGYPAAGAYPVLNSGVAMGGGAAYPQAPNTYGSMPGGPPAPATADTAYGATASGFTAGSSGSAYPAPPVADAYGVTAGAAAGGGYGNAAGVLPGGAPAAGSVYGTTSGSTGAGAYPSLGEAAPVSAGPTGSPAGYPAMTSLSNASSAAATPVATPRPLSAEPSASSVHGPPVGPHMQHMHSFMGGPGQAHTYGGLQHHASFSSGTPHTPGVPWVLPDTNNLPHAPAAQIVGPFLRLVNFDPASGAYHVSALVVTHPSLIQAGHMGPPASSPPLVQLHYGVNCPAYQAAACQLLDDFMGYRFYRFDMHLTLADAPGVCNYLVGLAGAPAPHSSHSFHLPGRGQSWRWMFYSCNGFHEHEIEKKYGGIGNLWRDVMQQHACSPFHLQVGGGDQIYCDGVFDVPAMKAWLGVVDPQKRMQVDMSPTLLHEVEQYYFGNYCRHFGDPALAPALASIPYLFVWDDHDIFDGWGSYNADLQHSKVFQGLFAVARRFYLLFQHHCTYANSITISNTLGTHSYSIVRNIGPDVLLMIPDTRAERSVTQIVPEANWQELLALVDQKLAASQGRIRHLAVLLTVPIVYPKIPLSERLLGGISGALSKSHALRNHVAKYGGSLPSGVMSQFNEPDLLDDLRDHWTSAEHAKEREQLVRRLQGLVAKYGVRVTFLSGDVHLAAYGCFQSHPKVHNRVEDPKYMLQVVSSAIGNEPPPPGVVNLMETTNTASTVMQDTLDKMIRTFKDGKRLKGSRNWCDVVPVHEPALDPANGVLLPPGSLLFTLRVEALPPGAQPGRNQIPTIECYCQAAPVLVPQGGSQGYGVTPQHGAQYPWAGNGGCRPACQPIHAGNKKSDSMKKLGHALGNMLGRI